VDDQSEILAGRANLSLCLLTSFVEGETMSAVTEIPRGSSNWTIDDLERLPDDGRRYELLDGRLLVTPSPVVKHQVVGFEIAKLLDARRPPHLAVVLAPMDWQPDRRNSFQPDVLVVRNEKLSVKNITASPVLVVEVLSPSTRGRDLVEKRVKYESAGVASYWVVDPDVPWVQALELVDGRYRVAGEASGDEQVTLERPFPVTVTPSTLLSRYNW
jgi:Uma2 family endonuclease